MGELCEAKHGLEKCCKMKRQGNLAGLPYQPIVIYTSRGVGNVQEMSQTHERSVKNVCSVKID